MVLVDANAFERRNFTGKPGFQGYLLQLPFVKFGLHSIKCRDCKNDNSVYMLKIAGK